MALEDSVDGSAGGEYLLGDALLILYRFVKVSKVKPIECAVVQCDYLVLDRLIDSRCMMIAMVFMDKCTLTVLSIACRKARYCFHANTKSNCGLLSANPPNTVFLDGNIFLLFSLRKFLHVN